MKKFSAGILMSELQEEVRRVFTHASTFHLTDNELLELLQKEVREPLNRKWKNGKAVHSLYLKGYVQGAVSTYREQLWNEVEFCYRIDGVLYSTHKQTSKRSIDELYNANRANDISNSVGNFYWKDRNDIPFTTFTK
jgi:hypothetical protein